MTFLAGAAANFRFESGNFTANTTTSFLAKPSACLKTLTAWPDTVDYEGPQLGDFCAAPVGPLPNALNKHWQLNFGLEKPGSEVDTSIDPDARSVNHAPDGGFNVRWEDSEIGHVQFGTILRDIGVKGPIAGDQSTFGWGLNLSAVFNLTKNDSLQGQLTYGEGSVPLFQ
jgi:hypothetical protein